MSVIQTRSGRMFNVLDPHPDVVDLQDIAHALSRVARFTGHTSGDLGYSVAQHSVLVAAVAMATIPNPALATEAGRAGLLHDASEAYIADVARPLKHSPALAGYRDAEARVQAAILARFRVAAPNHDPIPHDAEAAGAGCLRCAVWEAVHRADGHLLATEAAELMAPLAPGYWDGLPEPLDAVRPLVQPWAPNEARRMFLELWADLNGEGTGELASLVAELWSRGAGQVTG